MEDRPATGDHNDPSRNGATDALVAWTRGLFTLAGKIFVAQQRMFAAIMSPTRSLSRPAAPEQATLRVAPPIEEPAEKPAPKAEESAPEVEKPAPEVRKPAPEVEKPAPKVQKPAPDVEKPKPEPAKAAAPKSSASTARTTRKSTAARPAVPKTRTTRPRKSTKPADGGNPPSTGDAG